MAMESVDELLEVLDEALPRSAAMTATTPASGRRVSFVEVMHLVTSRPCCCSCSWPLLKWVWLQLQRRRLLIPLPLLRLLPPLLHPLMLLQSLDLIILFSNLPLVFLRNFYYWY